MTREASQLPDHRPPPHRDPRHFHRYFSSCGDKDLEKLRASFTHLIYEQFTQCSQPGDSHCQEKEGL